MSLPWREALTARLMPAGVYYASRLSDEQAWGEHELGLLGEVLRPGGTAVDVGANQGVFSYAFSRIADRVEAFEPNPDCADFARRMLGPRARVHQVALSNHCGTGHLVVPISEEGTVLHFGGALKPAGVKGPGCRAQRFQVEVRTLDSYGFRDVHAIKVDVEGSEMEVLEGARATIARDRPPLIVELLTGAHADPLGLVEQICTIYGYAACLATPDCKTVAAGPVLRSLGSNTTWGSPIRNRNVLFLPR
jgi:FkbM family methyltransferase